MMSCSRKSALAFASASWPNPFGMLTTGCWGRFTPTKKEDRMHYLKGLGIEALKYLAGIAVVCAIGFVITICTSGCAMWMEPAGYAVYHERPMYAYRAPAYYHHYRGRPVVVHGHHVAHGQPVVAHAPHGKKSAVVKSPSSGGKKAAGG